MDVILPAGTEVFINNKKSTVEEKVYNNFTVDWSSGANPSPYQMELDLTEESYTYDELPEEDETDYNAAPQPEPEESNPVNASVAENTVEEAGPVLQEFTVIVNHKPVRLHGKKDYIYVDVFDFIDFDLKTPRSGTVVTRLNGANASYIQKLKPNDIIEIYWEE